MLCTIKLVPPEVGDASGGISKESYFMNQVRPSSHQLLR